MTNMFMKELLEDYPERPDNPFTCEIPSQRREKMREDTKIITAQETAVISDVTKSHWFVDCMIEIPKAAIKGKKQYELTSLGRSASPPPAIITALKMSLEDLGYKVIETKSPFSLIISWGIQDEPIDR